jgi:hypothetical protein
LIALFETRQGYFVRNWTNEVIIRDGFLETRNPLPAGDYLLILKREMKNITIRSTKGTPVKKFLCSKVRQLETTTRKHIQISQVSETNDLVTIRLSNASQRTRVHVFCSHFLPDYHVYDNLQGIYLFFFCLFFSCILFYFFCLFHFIFLFDLFVQDQFRFMNHLQSEFPAQNLITCLVEVLEKNIVTFWKENMQKNSLQIHLLVHLYF